MSSPGFIPNDPSRGTGDNTAAQLPVPSGGVVSKASVIATGVKATDLGGLDQATANGAYAPISTVWKPNTAVKAGQVVISPTTGALVRAKTDFTTGSVFSSSNWYTLTTITLPAPSGDTTGVTDTAAIQPVEDFLSAIGSQAVLVGQPGTYIHTGLTKRSFTRWQAMKLRLANGANVDSVKSAGFDALTLGGAHSDGSGVNSPGLFDVTIDGNKANNTGGAGVGAGLRIFGYNWDLYNVVIYNTAGTGLYTEWGNYGSAVESMESRVYGLKIHDAGRHGWHHRGPHDSTFNSVILYDNALSNFLAETVQNTKVAAASNTVDVATFTGSGVLNVASTLGWPSASLSATQGAITVATSAGTAVLTYTGITAQTFTGVTLVSGTGTLATNGAVTPVGGGYSANGALAHQMHTWGVKMTGPGIQVDGGFCIFTESMAESVGSSPQVLFRGNDNQWWGGQIFTSFSATQGSGVQIGDAVNAVANTRIEAKINNFVGTSTATAPVYVANSAGGNKLNVVCYVQTGGTALWGTLNYAAGDRAEVMQNGKGTTIFGRQTFVTDAVGTAFTINNGTNDLFNFNTANKRFEINNGGYLRFYSGSYGGTTIEVDGQRGHLTSGGGVPTVAAAAAASAASIGSTSNDMKMVVTGTSNGTAGLLVTVTYNQQYFGNVPEPAITPQSAAAAAAGLYVVSKTLTGFVVGCANAPANGAAIQFSALVIG